MLIQFECGYFHHYLCHDYATLTRKLNGKASNDLGLLIVSILFSFLSTIDVAKLDQNRRTLNYLIAQPLGGIVVKFHKHVT